MRLLIPGCFSTFDTSHNLCKWFQHVHFKIFSIPKPPVILKILTQNRRRTKTEFRRVVSYQPSPVIVPGIDFKVMFLADLGNKICCFKFIVSLFYSNSVQTKKNTVLQELFKLKPNVCVWGGGEPLWGKTTTPPDTACIQGQLFFQQCNSMCLFFP